MNDPVGLFNLATPPSNARAEQALLGALLANNRAFEAVSGFLQSDHFADPLHGRIYAAIAARCDAGRLADAVTLVQHAADWADDVTPVAEIRSYVAQLVQAMVGLAGVAEYGHAIRECWHRRELMQIGQDLHARALSGSFDSAADIHESAESALFELAEKGASAEAVTPGHVAMGQAIEAALRGRASPGGMVGLTTGLLDLDEITGGLRAGDMWLLGARPSMGKTTLGLSIAAGAVQAGARVLFVSLEMTAEQIGGQLVAGLAPVQRDGATRGRVRERDDYGRFAYRPISDAEIGAMMACQKAMTRRHLVIDECRSGTVAAIRNSARRMKRRGGLDLVVIDYVGLLRVPELARSDNKVLEIGRISAGIKALAKELGIPVLALSQLNRTLEGREDKRPIMSDLRDSGSLEQDADGIAFLHRETYYLQRGIKRAGNESDEKFANRVAQHNADVLAAAGSAELIIGKQRKGRTGTIKLAYGEETTWFSDWHEGSPQ